MGAFVSKCLVQVVTWSVGVCPLLVPGSVPSSSLCLVGECLLSSANLVVGSVSAWW